MVAYHPFFSILRPATLPSIENTIFVIGTVMNTIHRLIISRNFHRNFMIFYWVEQINFVTEFRWNSGELSFHMKFMWNVHIKFMLGEFHVTISLTSCEARLKWISSETYLPVYPTGSGHVKNPWFINLKKNLKSRGRVFSTKNLSIDFNWPNF